MIYVFRPKHKVCKVHIHSFNDKEILFIPGEDIRGYKYITMLVDPQTGNLFVLISSVGVQHRDELIQVQKGPWTTRQTDIKSQKARG